MDQSRECRGEGSLKELGGELGGWVETGWVEECGADGRGRYLTDVIKVEVELRYEEGEGKAR